MKAIIKGSFGKWIMVSTIFAFIFLCANEKESLIHWVQAGITLKQQERQIEMLARRNAALDAQIKSLSTDRDSLETFAREKFLFSIPGEDVYIFDE